MAKYTLISTDATKGHVTVKFSTDDSKDTITDTMCDIPMDDLALAQAELEKRALKYEQDMLDLRSHAPVVGPLNSIKGKEQTVELPPEPIVEDVPVDTVAGV